MQSRQKINKFSSVLDIGFLKSCKHLNFCALKKAAAINELIIYYMQEKSSFLSIYSIIVDKKIKILKKFDVFRNFFHSNAICFILIYLKIALNNFLFVYKSVINQLCQLRLARNSKMQEKIFVK